MRNAWRRFAAWSTALAAAAAVTLSTTELPAPMVTVYKNVKLSVLAVRASKEGDDYVTASLGEAGEQIKKKFGAKRVTLIGHAEIDPKGENAKAPVDLGDELKAKIVWRAVLNDAAHFHVTVTRGADTLIDKDEAIAMNAEGAATGKIEKDTLVLLMTPKGDAGK